MAGEFKFAKAGLVSMEFRGRGGCSVAKVNSQYRTFPAIAEKIRYITKFFGAESLQSGFFREKQLSIGNFQTKTIINRNFSEKNS